MTENAQPTGDLWQKIRDCLDGQGIDLEAICGEAIDRARVKVVCVGANLKESLREMSGTTRDQVVMVRIDEETSRALDEWVETGAVKSRSEAAALFIREGLKIREQELAQLREALNEVEKAKEQLREKARDVFGGAS